MPPLLEENGVEVIEQHYCERILAYLGETYAERIEEVLNEPDEYRYIALNVDIVAFLFHFPNAGQHFHAYPR